MYISLADQTLFYPTFVVSVKNISTSIRKLRCKIGHDSLKQACLLIVQRIAWSFWQIKYTNFFSRVQTELQLHLIQQVHYLQMTLAWKYIKWKNCISDCGSSSYSDYKTLSHTKPWLCAFNTATSHYPIRKINCCYAGLVYIPNIFWHKLVAIINGFHVFETLFLLNEVALDMLPCKQELITHQNFVAKIQQRYLFHS